LGGILEDAGVTLLKADGVPSDNNTNSFKKITSDQPKNADGTPQLDANGKKVYKKTGC
jgi:hypothetical protein